GRTPGRHSGTRLKASPPTTTRMQPSVNRLMVKGWKIITSAAQQRAMIAYSTRLAALALRPPGGTGVLGLVMSGPPARLGRTHGHSPAGTGHGADRPRRSAP